MSEKAKQIIDLSREPDTRLAPAAIAAVRTLRSGTELCLLTRDDPALLMQSLNLQFRSALAWRAEARMDHWETSIQLATDSPPVDTVEALVRDHRRLNELLGKALRRLNAGDMTGAAPMLQHFVAGLRAHLSVEDEILAPVLGPRPVPEPLQTMLHEHDELRQQIEALIQSLEAPAEGKAPQAWEVEPFVALLSGTLAKHEHREEEHLFPLWQRQLAALPAEQREALFRRLQAALAA